MRTIPICVLLLSAVACNRMPSATPAELVQWVENPKHGLLKQKIIDGIQYDLQYRPLEYITAKEADDKLLTTAFIQERKARLSGMEYYHLRVGSANGGEVLMANCNSQDDYHTRNTYLMFDFRQDIHLVANDDTLPCMLYHYENHQGLAPYADILMAFEKTGTAADRTILINDKVFGNGLIKLEISEQDIQQVPALIVQ